DEPTAVLSEPEADSLFELVAKLKAGGTTVLYISHRLAEVGKICDQVTVLRDGALIATMPAKGTTPAELADLMVGRPLTDFYPPKTAAPTGEPVFEVDRFGRASFSVRPGEIVGLAGLVGAGRTELAEAIFGAAPPEGWEVRLNGSPCRIRSPKEAMKRGIAYVSEDRKGVGLHLSLNVIENITLANLRAYGDFALSRHRERQAAATWKQELDIRAGFLEDAVLNVSGGNQQKIAIAKWLDTKPKVLILDEPTRGVDVGAKREIYNLIQRLAGEGMACIVISSELPEVIGICHRSLVMREGKIVGELSGAALTEESVMRLAAGVAA
ncbi:MAG TPA: sugar ABC transporter ATP-binding protein, partial [Fimbriimonadaceae bacterium]|nr:sugar ABC transporter ATP-binding protein [Fimbriimonadaceae bacterium]